MAIRGLHRSRAFTLVEALVATALLVGTMLVVSNVFSLTSTAAGRTVAHAEVVQAAHAFEQAVRDQIRYLKPSSMLLIDSPEPVREPDIGYGPTDPATAAPARFPMRHDRLAFFVSSDLAAFESVTDNNIPSVGNANSNSHLAAASEALVFFGPSYPADDIDPQGHVFYTQQFSHVVAPTLLPGKSWILAHRTILLGAPNSSFVSYFPTSGAGVNTPGSYPLGVGGMSNYPPAGIFGCTIDATIDTADALLNRNNGIIDAVNNRTWNAIEGLWALNVCPTRVVPDINFDNPAQNAYYFRRAGFNLQPRIADLRIEWSDGSVVDPVNIAVGTAPTQPRVPTVQWFGAPRNTNDLDNKTGWNPPNTAPPTSGDVCEKRRWLQTFNGLLGVGTLPEAVTYGGLISNLVFDTPELTNANSAIPSIPAPPLAGPNSHAYRAVWIPSTWSNRPRALRFTFRVYDSQDRINNLENTDLAIAPTAPTIESLKRYGLEYSFIVSVP